MRRVSIFGATGSIGASTIDLVARRPDDFDVVALTGASNVDQLARDAINLRAKLAVTADEARLSDLRDALAGTGIEAAAGRTALLDAADRPTDWAMSGIVGSAGLEPGLRALRHGGTLALANKESLVCAGPLLRAEALRHGATLLPVDSEHSAIFQALQGESRAAIEKVTITGSGGGLREWPLDRLPEATPDDAGHHPNWDMGQRITIDSASMMNKAMELIETHALFDLPRAQIDTVIHPQSLIHALVHFVDGGIIAHLGAHDMRHAIGYALNYPDRQDLPVDRLDLTRIGTLEFSAPDPERYPAIDLAWRVIERGGLAGAVFNAAKEEALDQFIGGRILFTEMAPLVAECLDRLDDCLEADEITLDMVHEIDGRTRQTARDLSRSQGA